MKAVNTEQNILLADNGIAKKCSLLFVNSHLWVITKKSVLSHP